MRITVSIPKILVPEVRLTELKQQFAIRTHLHLTHLGVTWGTPAPSADPVFEEVAAHRKEIVIVVGESHQLFTTETARKHFADLLEMSLSEILDGLEVPFASVVVRTPAPSANSTPGSTRVSNSTRHP